MITNCFRFEFSDLDDVMYNTAYATEDILHKRFRNKFILREGDLNWPLRSRENNTVRLFHVGLSEITDADKPQ